MAINGFDIWEHRVQLVTMMLIVAVTVTTDSALAFLGEPLAAGAMCLTGVACIGLAFLLYQHNPARTRVDPT